jgi:hypothetical protein
LFAYQLTFHDKEEGYKNKNETNTNTKTNTKQKKKLLFAHAIVPTAGKWVCRARSLKEAPNPTTSEARSPA